MRGFVDRMQGLEGHDGVLSISFCHGFPWGDVAEGGARMLVITDDDAAGGERLAENLGRELWALRERSRDPSIDLDSAIDRALAAPRGPVVIADVADNCGAGAPSDSTFVLRRLLERGVEIAAIAALWDPVAVRICQDAGVGARLDVRIGGKCGPVSGDPVDLLVEVRGLAALNGLPFGGTSFDLGDSAWVHGAGVDVVLSTIRCQCFQADVFRRIGCDPAERRILVPKSMQHFRAGFADFATEILYATTPGAVAPDFAAIPYVRRTAPYWPRVADPFEDG